MIKFYSLGLLASLGFTQLALAQVKTESELFGSPDEDKKDETKPTDDKAKTSDKPVNDAIVSSIDYSSALEDKLQIGGRLEIRANANKVDDQRFQESPYFQNKTADVYFDTRPNKDVRAFFRMRFYEDSVRSSGGSDSLTNDEEPVAATEQTGVSGIESAIDELWLKWDIDDTLFVTAGKQHVKWGRGRFWNPIDFTAVEVKDPFALFDRRLGQEMIKLHLPLEKEGHNFYLIAQFDDVARNDDVGIAARAEFSVGDNGEFAISAQSKRDRAIKAGVDAGFGLGNFDIGIESAWLTRDTGPRYQGDFDLLTRVFPTETYDDKKVYNQSVLNVEYVWKYNDDDNLNLGVEGFWNEMGYDTRILEFYSLLNGRSKVLYAGKNYVATYARLSAPGDWNDSSFILNAVQNLSDKTALARFTATYTFYKQITVEGYVSRCFGDYGELCFRVPDNVLNGISTLPDTIQPLLANLPRKTTRTIFGGSLTMNF